MANFFALTHTSGHARRSFSRTKRDSIATLKPTTPLLAPNRGPLKPASPLHPKTAAKTPISRPQRRRRFQPHTDTSEQRRWRFQSRLSRHPQRRRRIQSRLGQHPQRRRRFQTTGPAGLQGLAAVPVGGGRAWPDNKPPISDQAPLVWRAPEGPEGTGGLRGAAPNEVRPPSLAGGRALRRPEHPWRHKQGHNQHLQRNEAATGFPATAS